jgi:predicted TIM-barrel fold metal-dependent hydrolase
MAIIDAQVHAYERDHPGRPWAAVLHGPPEVTGDDMVRAMDQVGVDGALLVSPWTMYRFDAGYAIEVHATHPDRFALIKPVDPRDPGVRDAVAEWSEVPGSVGVRMMLTSADTDYAVHDGVNAVADEAGRRDLPLNILCWGRLDVIDRLAAAHADTRIVIDHLGLTQPFEPPPPDAPWADLPQLLALARHTNVAVKITGACTLAHEPFPYPDIWDPLARIFDGFGFDRCLWGTDWTRATALLTYAEGVDAFRLTDRLNEGERQALMGGTLSHIYRWAPGS